jgi:hypothetical protein
MMDDENELTPEERMAFQDLQQDARPSRILEERIVKSLREEGILGDRVRSRHHGTAGAERPRWLRSWALAGSIAASLLLFASGTFVGHWMGTRSTTQAFLAVREQDATQLALRIQEAGTAYVSALVQLGSLQRAAPSLSQPKQSASLTSADIRQGTEVALGSLYAATYELARLNPGDTDVRRVLQILEERRARDAGLGVSTVDVVRF